MLDFTNISIDDMEFGFFQGRYDYIYVMQLKVLNEKLEDEIIEVEFEIFDFTRGNQLVQYADNLEFTLNNDLGTDCLDDLSTILNDNIQHILDTSSFIK